MAFPLIRGFVVRYLLKIHFFFRHICNGAINMIVAPKLSPKYGAQLFFMKHIKPGAAILDLGCGNGTYTYLFAEKASTIDAVDISGDAIRDAQRRRQKPNIKYIVSNAASFVSQCKKRYDIAVLGEVLSFIEDPERFLKELRSVSDAILLRETKFDNDVLALVAQDVGVRKSPWHEFSKSELVALLTKTGYKIIEDFDTYDMFIKAVPLMRQ